MYFVAFLLTLGIIDDGVPVTLVDCHLNFQALIGRLRQGDAPLHEEHISVALLHSDRDRARVRLAFSAVSETRLTTILNELLSRSPLKLGNRRFDVEAVDLTDPLWAGIGTWANVLSEKNGRFIRFSFATPLVTAEPGYDRQDALPFPDPQILFSRLSTQWRALGGPALPHDGEQLVQAGGCVVSNYRLYTVPVELSGHFLVGYRGWLEYECRERDAESIGSLNALARLAFYTGSGYLAAEGMGATSTRIT